MMTTYMYFMQSDEDDFRHEFSGQKHPMLSWFLKYKWRNGIVWLPFPVDLTPSPKVDDELILVLDNTVLGATYIIEAEHVSYAMSKPELCVYFDSDCVHMPTTATQVEYKDVGRVAPFDASIDVNTTVKEVPVWLSNFLTEKQQ